jgi:L-threonate 2-dehydrogenase
MAVVGIIGVGNMGLGMALRLLDLGHAVRVRDIDPARERLALSRGASVHADAATVARGSDALIVAVVDAAQTRQVLLGNAGALQGLARGTAVLLCPTIAPQDVEELAAVLAREGVDAIDAPMSGGPQRARDGSMSLMVACAEEAYARWRDLLADLSSRLFHVGTQPGAGARTKLVNNLLATINLAGAAEALALAQRVGLDPAATLAVIEASSGQSWIGSERLRRALAGDPAVGAQVALLAKDSTLALELARSARVDIPVGRAAQNLFAEACAQGLARQDDSVLWRWLADRDSG